jgi:hypothetical protein
MSGVYDNRPDIPTGERIMKGRRVPVYPTGIAVRIDADPDDPLRVVVIGPNGSRANMTAVACVALYHLAPGAVVTTSRVGVG